MALNGPPSGPLSGPVNVPSVDKALNFAHNRDAFPDPYLLPLTEPELMELARLLREEMNGCLQLNTVAGNQQAAHLQSCMRQVLERLEELQSDFRRLFESMIRGTRKPLSADELQDLSVRQLSALQLQAKAVSAYWQQRTNDPMYHSADLVLPDFLTAIQAEVERRAQAPSPQVAVASARQVSTERYRQLMTVTAAAGVDAVMIDDRVTRIFNGVLARTARAAEAFQSEFPDIRTLDQATVEYLQRRIVAAAAELHYSSSIAHDTQGAKRATELGKALVQAIIKSRAGTHLERQKQEKRVRQATQGRSPDIPAQPGATRILLGRLWAAVKGTIISPDTTPSLPDDLGEGSLPMPESLDPESGPDDLVRLIRANQDLGTGMSIVAASISSSEVNQLSETVHERYQQAMSRSGRYKTIESRGFLCTVRCSDRNVPFIVVEGRDSDGNATLDLRPPAKKVAPEPDEIELDEWDLDDEAGEDEPAIVMVPTLNSRPTPEELVAAVLSGLSKNGVVQAACSRDVLDAVVDAQNRAYFEAAGGAQQVPSTLRGCCNIRCSDGEMVFEIFAPQAAPQSRIIYFKQ